MTTTLFGMELQAVKPVKQKWNKIATALAIAGAVSVLIPVTLPSSNRTFKGISILATIGAGAALMAMGTSAMSQHKRWKMMEDAEDEELAMQLEYRKKMGRLKAQIGWENEVLQLLAYLEQIDPVLALAYAKEMDDLYNMVMKFGYDPETLQPWLSDEQPAIPAQATRKAIPAQSKQVDEDENIEYLVDVDADNLVFFDASGASAAELLQGQSAQPQASTQAVSTPAVTPVTSQKGLPPVRNLAKEIAQLDGHIGIVSKTRSGKTTALLATIAECLNAGHKVYVFDGKGDKRLRALQQYPNVIYIQCNTPERAVQAINIIEEIITHELQPRQDMEHPGQVIDVFIDENNLIRASVDRAQKEQILPSNYGILFWDGQTERILLQGAAANIRLRGSAHTSRAKDWGWNTGVLDSLTWVSLARCGSYESVEDLIRYQVVGDDKAAYTEQLKQFKKQALDTPIALTLLHPQGFYRLPDYRSIENAIMQSAAAPETTHGLMIDEPVTHVQAEIVDEIDGDELDSIIAQALQNQGLNFVGQQWVNSAVGSANNS